MSIITIDRSSKERNSKETTISGLFSNNSYLPQAVIRNTQLAAMMFVETAVDLVVVPMLQVVTATTNNIFLLEKQESAGGDISN